MDKKIPEETIDLIDLDGMSNVKIGEKFEKPNLDGKDVTIQKVELVPRGNLEKTKSGKEYRPVTMRIYYDDNNYENYGGCRIFQGSSEVTFDPKGSNVTSRLFRLWLAKMNLKADDVSRKDFFLGLEGMKARIRSEVKSFDGRDYQKNIIESFV